MIGTLRSQETYRFVDHEVRILITLVPEFKVATQIFKMPPLGYIQKWFWHHPRSPTQCPRTLLGKSVRRHFSLKKVSVDTFT